MDLKSLLVLIRRMSTLLETYFGVLGSLHRHTFDSQKNIKFEEPTKCHAHHKCFSLVHRASKTFSITLFFPDLKACSRNLLEFFKFPYNTLWCQHIYLGKWTRKLNRAREYEVNSFDVLMELFGQAILSYILKRLSLGKVFDCTKFHE